MTENAKNAIIKVLESGMELRMPARHKKYESSEWEYGTVEKLGVGHVTFRASISAAIKYGWGIHLNSTDTYDLEILDPGYRVASQKDSIDSMSNSKTIVIEFDRVVLVNQNF